MGKKTGHRPGPHVASINGIWATLPTGLCGVSKKAAICLHRAGVLEAPLPVLELILVQDIPQVSPNQISA